jgi:hypothetical protein
MNTSKGMSITTIGPLHGEQDEMFSKVNDRQFVPPAMEKTNGPVCLCPVAEWACRWCRLWVGQAQGKFCNIRNLAGQDRRQRPELCTYPHGGPSSGSPLPRRLVPFRPTSDLIHQNNHQNGQDTTYREHEAPCRLIIHVVECNSRKESQNNTNIQGHFRPSHQLTTVRGRRYFCDIQRIDLRGKAERSS